MRQRRFTLLTLTLLFVLLSAAGCSRQSVLIPPNTAALLAEDVELDVAVKVDGVLIKTRYLFRAGHYWIVPYEWAVEE